MDKPTRAKQCYSEKLTHADFPVTLGNILQKCWGVESLYCKVVTKCPTRCRWKVLTGDFSLCETNLLKMHAEGLREVRRCLTSVMGHGAAKYAITMRTNYVITLTTPKD